MADPVNILSLYSGSGMHDEAVRAGLRVLGYESRILGYVEREASAAAWLLGRMEAQALEPASVFCGDLRDLDARPMRGWVDIVVASPPCQPYSSAGKRAGNADERSHGDGDGPLPHTIRIIDECRPALVWFENVSEWVTGGHFRGFGDELSRVGYAIQSPIFLAAEDVGAPHQRERVYILCVADAGNRNRSENCNATQGEKESQSEWTSIAMANHGLQHVELFKRAEGAEPARSGGELDDGDRARWATPRRFWELQSGELGLRCPELAERQSRGRGERGQSSGGDGFAERSGEELGDAGGARREGAERGGASPDAGATARRSTAESGCDVPLFPPGRTDYRRWAELVTRGLDPALIPCVERGFPTLADGLAISNSDLLRLGGNGVVPLAAGAAFVEAVRRLRNA